MNRDGVSSLVCALTVLALICCGCGGSDSGPLESNGRPVVLISIDSLRADHCTPYGYKPQFAPNEDTTPFLQRLAQEGVTFENASSTTSWTLPSHMSLLTGMSCREHGVRNRTFGLAEGIELASGRFQRAGYATGGFYSAPFLHGSWGFAQGFDHYEAASPYLQGLDAAKAIGDTQTRGSLHGLHDNSHGDNECSERVVDAALKWLADGKRYEEPFFVFLHLWDPHYDYEPPAGYTERFDPGYSGTVDGKDFMNPKKKWEGRDLEHILARYDAEIRYTDDQIARFFAQLEAWGLGDAVIVAVSSDHGDEFYEHGKKGHQKTLYEEVTHIPVVVRAPNAAPAGARVPQTVSLCDVAPTLLALAGIPEWADRTGRSMVELWEDGGLEREAIMDLYMNAQNFQEAWRGGSQKVIWWHNQQRMAAFDLAADPGEQKPRAVQSPASDPAGKKASAAFSREGEHVGFADPMTETAAMTSALSEVGYVDDEH